MINEMKSSFNRNLSLFVFRYVLKESNDTSSTCQFKLQICACFYAYNLMSFWSRLFLLFVGIAVVWMAFWNYLFLINCLDYCFFSSWCLLSPNHYLLLSLDGGTRKFEPVMTSPNKKAFLRESIRTYKERFLNCYNNFEARRFVADQQFEAL